jgi:hypothetical protein
MILITITHFLDLDSHVREGATFIFIDLAYFN